jgi:hypothetical protein
MVSEKRNEDLAWAVLKQETQGKAPPALEQALAELANAEAAVHVGPAEGLVELAQGQQALRSLVSL